ncbi:tRNA(Ile)-lysidine synthase [Baekduia alba]|uniref:tRNA lysidine(34) synthetase TilS n=1 Tax=Baekduia alba TaxID=2997333 RepID=UPI002341A9A8|nr:tRNA lysidine(34) synthetase TilS [Baekduia alba]WCB95868.1 tRNA(Ile)-lysidine synthase [Baekduia alba]
MEPGELVERVRETGLLGPPVVVLLSGGRDSTCLLHVVVGLMGTERVRALHVDYGLRGAASDADREHCVELCEELEVSLQVERAARPAGASGNTQAWARDLRYAVGARTIAAWRDDAILAAGHTLSDQVETILYRLAVSPGRRALLGMEAARGRLVRPLLAAEITRAQTAAYCLDRRLAWREDAANLDRRYARARVREDLLPALRAVDDRAEVNVLRTAQLLREEAAVLDEVVAEALRAGRGAAIARDALAGLPAALGRLVLRRLAEDATGGLCPRAAARLGDVLALGPDGALDLGDGARAIVAAGVVRVGRTPARGPKR